MDVIIFGASGGIGQFAVKHALAKGFTVTAYLRNAQKLQISDRRLHVIQAEITDKEAMRSAVAGQDAVIWCVGIPMKRKYATMNSLIGHQNLLQVMKAVGVRRLIDYGTPSVSFSEDKPSLITIVPGIMAGIMYPTPKKEIVAIGELLKASDLDWTLVRFMAPKDTAYTGHVKIGFGDVKMKFSISRADIGAFMVNQVTSKKYVKSMPIIGS